jgi:hypothetical protein
LPRLFKKWRKQPGYTFKANGKVFRGAGREAGDETFEALQRRLYL